MTPCAAGWLAGCALLVTASAIATAAPRKPAASAPSRRAIPHPATHPATPEAARAADLDRLDHELTALQLKQANFAAVKVARKALALQIQLTGPDSVEVERRKQTLAGLLSAIGDTRGQVALDQEILQTAERLHGAESREVLNALALLIGGYWAANRYDELEVIEQRMLALTEKLDGARSETYAMQLTAYGSLLSARGQLASAEQAYEQALAIQESRTGDEQQLLGSIETLASAYWQANQRNRAIALFDRALAISERPNTPAWTRSGTLWMVVSLYHYGGRDDLAEPLMQRAIELYESQIAAFERDSPDSPQLSAAFGQLGYAHRQRGDLERAGAAFERAIATDAKYHRFSAWATTLAEVRRMQGRPRDALALLETARAELERLSPQSSTAFNSILADVLREIGDYARAARLLAAYRASVAKTYGRRHPLYGLAELSTAYLDMASGKPAAAEQLLADGLDIAERDLQLMLRTGTEADHAVYFARNTYQLDTAINFEVHYAPHRASAARLGLTTLLRRKGRVLDAAAESMTALRARLSPADEQLLDDLASARAQLAKLTVAGPAATGEADFAKEVAAYEDRIQRLEIQIGTSSAAYRAASQPIELAAVQRAIPADARLIEIVNYQPGDPTMPYRAAAVPLPRKYAAYVVGRTGDPVLIDLGPAAAIDDAVDQFRRAVSDPDNDRAGELGHALYALTMARIAPALGGATSALIAPDGALNVVPFAALLDDRGEPLVKRYTFTYLTSGRDLLRLAIRSQPRQPGAIFADPAFDTASPGGAVAGAPRAAPNAAPGAAPGTPRGTAATVRGRRSADLGAQRWKPLPGTREEASEVSRAMPGLVVYRGERATETAVKAVHGPRVLHLATHGFFLQNAPDAAAAPAAGAAVPGAPAQSDAPENPLLRSGLALAGANRRESGEDDGILTAMEAAGLDLWGTKLVVLSACETGVGKVTNGDGVYGLRRALVIAGAESLVMSLWQVDDTATRDLMAGYYARLSAGRPRSTALRDVQLQILARPEYAHPYYWASFLPAGANTPID